MVSVVITALLLPDRGHELTTFTRNCIKSFREYCGVFELIIVDNGSPVDYHMLLGAVPNIYVRNASNMGWARAVNQGMMLATNDFIVVSNNDIELVDDWISDAIAAWEPGIGVVSSHLYREDGNKPGAIYASIGTMFGSLWLTHKDVLNHAGYMSEDYQWTMFDDKDYWQQMKQAGFNFKKAGWCKHVGNATWGKLPNQEKVYEKNKAIYEGKWNK